MRLFLLKSLPLFQIGYYQALTTKVRHIGKLPIVKVRLIFNFFEQQMSFRVTRTLRPWEIALRSISESDERQHHWHFDQNANYRGQCRSRV